MALPKHVSARAAALAGAGFCLALSVALVGPVLSRNRTIEFSGVLSQIESWRANGPAASETILLTLDKSPIRFYMPVTAPPRTARWGEMLEIGADVSLSVDQADFEESMRAWSGLEQGGEAGNVGLEGDLVAYASRIDNAMRRGAVPPARFYDLRQRARLVMSRRDGNGLELIFGSISLTLAFMFGAAAFRRFSPAA